MDWTTFHRKCLILCNLKQLYKTPFSILLQNQMFYQLWIWWRFNNFESSKYSKLKKITKTFYQKLTIIIQNLRIRWFSNSSFTRWLIDYNQMGSSLHTSIFIFRTNKRFQIWVWVSIIFTIYMTKINEWYSILIILKRFLNDIRITSVCSYSLS